MTSEIAMTDPRSTKPLSGIKIIELAGIGPGPYAGQLFADMGAEVIVINRPGPMATIPNIANRGKKMITLDLRKADAVKAVLSLCDAADAMFEGFRPGVAEKFGLGPDVIMSRNPKLVYGRMTGWGQTGPLSKTAGHDINYISLTGALHAMGPADRPPAPPLNLVGDYGGGSLFLVSGMLAALLQAQRTGQGSVVDAAMVDGVSSMMGILYWLHGIGRWQDRREANLLDGAMPYYRCYATQDGRYVAVGCIEPQFFALMLKGLEIDPDDFGGQNDVSQHAEQHGKLEAVFARKTRDEWAAIFDSTDACVTPVLSYLEARGHPHIRSRQGLNTVGPFIHPRSAPVFDEISAHIPPDIPGPNDHAEDILSGLGYSPAEIAALSD